MFLYDDIPRNFLGTEIRELIKQSVFKELASRDGGVITLSCPNHMAVRLVAKAGIKEGFLQEAYLNQVMPYK